MASTLSLSLYVFSTGGVFARQNYRPSGRGNIEVCWFKTEVPRVCFWCNAMGIQAEFWEGAAQCQPLLSLFLLKHFKTSIYGCRRCFERFSLQIFFPCLVNKTLENRLSGHRWCQKWHLLAQQEGSCWRVPTYLLWAYFLIGLDGADKQIVLMNLVTKKVD